MSLINFASFFKLCVSSFLLSSSSFIRYRLYCNPLYVFVSIFIFSLLIQINSSLLFKINSRIEQTLSSHIQPSCESIRLECLVVRVVRSACNVVVCSPRFHIFGRTRRLSITVIVVSQFLNVIGLVGFNFPYLIWTQKL